ncbi:MAG TPA: hypothetical protein VGO52_15380 [Hyphomonadaceae bacterium]|jgi:hypothetical protein|nr:hypothetical protein [Hyphomonadaceae bacterium]
MESSETRATLTQAEFDAAVVEPDRFGYPTGERLFHNWMSGREVHMSGPEFALLNPSQKTLVLWRKIVRDAVFGGDGIFSLFHSNPDVHWDTALDLIDALDWPELQRRVKDALPLYRKWQEDVEASQEKLRLEIQAVMSEQMGQTNKVARDDVLQFGMILHSRGAIDMSDDTPEPDCPPQFKAWLTSQPVRDEAARRLPVWMRERQADLCIPSEG